MSRARLCNRSYLLFLQGDRTGPKGPKLQKLKAPRVRWVPEAQYALAAKLRDFYPYLFIFESALRIKIETLMSETYPNWWDAKIKADLPDVHKYAQDEMVKQARFPMLGAAKRLQPLECVTIGHLEQLIQKYNVLFVPSVFPTLQFFTGHMVIVKRVRNAIAHMAPSTTATDVRNAKNEIDILLQHLATV
jgi:hypothetical protein